MPVYAVGITPLLPVHTNQSLNDRTKQIAFADDLFSAGKLKKLERLVVGYTRERTPLDITLTRTKRDSRSTCVYEQAKVIFSDTSINITREGGKYLGGFIVPT